MLLHTRDSRTRGALVRTPYASALLALTLEGAAHEEWRQVIGFAILLILIVASPFRRGVRLERDDLILVRLMRARRIPWHEVADIRMDLKSLFAVHGRVHTRSGEVLVLPGIVSWRSENQEDPPEIGLIRNAWRSSSLPPPPAVDPPNPTPDP